MIVHVNPADWMIARKVYKAIATEGKAKTNTTPGFKNTMESFDYIGKSMETAYKLWRKERNSK